MVTRHTISPISHFPFFFPSHHFRIPSFFPLSLFPSSCNLLFLRLIFVPHDPSQSAWPVSSHPHTFLAPLVSVLSHCRLTSLPPPSFVVVAFPRCYFLLPHLVTFRHLCHPASPPSRYLFSITLPHLSRSLPWLWSCVAFPLLSNLFSPAPFFTIHPVSVLCYIHKVLRRLHSSAPSLSSHPVCRSPSLSNHFMSFLSAANRLVYECPENKRLRMPNLCE